jgi:hypothetical protein
VTLLFQLSHHQASQGLNLSIKHMPTGSISNPPQYFKARSSLFKEVPNVESTNSNIIKSKNPRQITRAYQGWEFLNLLQFRQILEAD